ncbi:hypothetical protein [Lachnotalea sp. AF33-28]|uniref:hypothetical protein n=1 Tax=Lachnotalea sp. AF33-28 TaxID=2292046 RepID=UPI0011C3F216|nr:hypothetical protein [Lachnotalea sp. AF33-28]
MKGRAAAGAGRSAGWGIGGRDSAVRSIPLRSISLTGFALWEQRWTASLMCKHNGTLPIAVPALLIAYVHSIPHPPSKENMDFLGEEMVDGDVDGGDNVDKLAKGRGIGGTEAVNSRFFDILRLVDRRESSTKKSTYFINGNC